MSQTRLLVLLTVGALLLGLLGRSVVAQDGADRMRPVGVGGQLTSVILAGPELQVKPLEDADPVVLRIVASYPHGDAFRYDLEYWGRDPGEHDLVQLLRRKDGSAPEGLEPLTVLIQNPLPPGQIEPHSLPQGSLPALGGYQVLTRILIVGWVLGLLLILFGWRGSKPAESAETSRPRTLAECLQPLVSQAQRGELEAPQQAELERLLLGYWRRKLGLTELPPAQALAQLKQHEEAGGLLRQVETWLHAPPGRGADVDLGPLLDPYKDLPADALEADEGTGEAPA